MENEKKPKPLDDRSNDSDTIKKLTNEAVDDWDWGHKRIQLWVAIR